MNCGIGHRCGLDLVLLWLWHRPAAAALIRSLAWEPPYATGAALEKKKKKQKNAKGVFTYVFFLYGFYLAKISRGKKSAFKRHSF